MAQKPSPHGCRPYELAFGVRDGVIPHLGAFPESNSAVWVLPDPQPGRAALPEAGRARGGNKRGSETTLPCLGARGCHPYAPGEEWLWGGDTVGTAVQTRPDKNGHQKYTNCSLLCAT